MKFQKKASLLILNFLWLFAIPMMSQQMHLFRTVYYPAEPYGGLEELELLVKQEVVYPNTLLESGEDGEVFITFIVDYQGNVQFKHIEDHGDSLFRAEASRIFDRILWEKDPSRNQSGLGYEKLKIAFNARKYEKLVKKRGYSALPKELSNNITSGKYYTINQVDEAPQTKEGNSINAFVQNNIKYPAIAYQRGISGRVTAEFIVEPYGKISNFKIVESLPGGCDAETRRLMRMIEWAPGKINGKAVRTLYRYQLNFVHPGGTVR
ncbi:MAG: hypothetical protein CMO34_04110 [Verrucomicrobia bacterium]|nr:hypothetical protein [Verrucomicrobiota bacterium]